MAVRNSILGSKSDEKGFRSIEHTWGEDYVVYPQIPWSALFTPDPNWRDTSNFFFKTSLDYVLWARGSNQRWLTASIDWISATWMRALIVGKRRLKT